MNELREFHELGFDHQSEPAADALAALLDSLRSFIRRHWKAIAFSGLLGSALAAGSLFVVSTRYEAAATILIDNPRVHFFGPQSVVNETLVATISEMEGQLEILKSDAIAKRVIQKMDLEGDADFALPKASGLLAMLGIKQGAPLTEAQREQHSLMVFAKLRIVEQVGAAFALRIGFKSHSSSVAAAVANAIADEYMMDLRSSGRVAARDASEWLQERLTQLRAQTAEAEQAVIDFKLRNGVIDADGKKMVGQQIAEISSQLTKTRSQLSEASARLERAQAAVRDYATSEIKPSLAEMMNNALTNRLIEQYLELSHREAEYAARFGAEHNATLKLRQRKEEVKSGLLADMQRLSQTFLSDKLILERQVQDLEGALKSAAIISRDTDTTQIKLRELVSVAQSYRGLYDGLIRRHSEAIVQQEQPSTSARYLSRAYEPLSRNMKKPLLLAALLGLGTTGLGVALAFLSDLKDRTFRTGDDVEHKLRGDFIAMVPTWRPAPNGATGGGTALVARAQVDANLLCSDNAFWAFMGAPTSVFAEAIGRIKFAILRQVEDGRIVGFTSVLPNEGASTIAASVAQSFAKSGRRIILVDCDFRHPELTRAAASHAMVGLQEILMGNATLDDAILHDASSGFAFLPGVVDRLKWRPEELLETEELTAVLSELRRRYDYVLVDLPPMFPMLDVSIMDRLIESYIIVVEWGASKIDTVAHALARCPGVHKRMLGFVLNKVDFGRLSLYDQRAADYYDVRRYSNYLLKGPVES
jgi:succinoglycan biosynthesis transport protein ExoP